MNEQRYTVFTQFGFQDNESDGWRHLDLEGLIARCLEEFGGDYDMVCWAPEWTEAYGGTKSRAVLHAESIAAGRLIEKEGDRYVARGVPEEEKLEAALALRGLFRDAMVRVGRANSFPQLFGGKPSATPTLDKLENTTERVRERLTWADTKPFNPFDGFLVTKGEVSQPAPASKFTSPDLKETSHQVSPGFGSAYIGKA